MGSFAFKATVLIGLLCSTAQAQPTLFYLTANGDTVRLRADSLILVVNDFIVRGQMTADTVNGGLLLLGPLTVNGLIAGDTLSGNWTITGTLAMSSAATWTTGSGATAINLNTTGINAPIISFGAGFGSAKTTLLATDSLGLFRILTLGSRRLLVDTDVGRARVTVGTTAGTGAGKMYAGDSTYSASTLVIANTRFQPGGVVTEGGLGSSAVNDTVSWTAQTGSIGATNFANTATGKMYRASIYCHTTTAGSGGTVLVTISWNDGAAKTYATATADLTSTANAGMAQDVVTFYVGSGTPTWSTTVAGAAGSPQYAVRISLERLW